MLYILTYRVPAGAERAKIVFFYNHTGFEVFEPIDETSTIENGNYGTGRPPDDIKRIRTYFGEEWSAINSNTIAETVIQTPMGSGSLQKTATDYPQNLCWDWNNNEARSYQEHNIFISIRTKGNLDNISFGYVEAALLYYIPDEEKPDTTRGNGTSVPDIREPSYNYRQVTSLLTTVSAEPHDPNFIRAAPGCITIDTIAKTKMIKYHIHFQNDGDGSAYKLAILVTMDKRLKEFIRLLRPSSFTVTTKDSTAHVDSLTFPSDNTFRLVIDDRNKDNQTGDENLVGVNCKDWFINPVTMGDITFTLTVPVDKAADFISKAEITFYSGKPWFKPMDPVETEPNILFVRSLCSEMLFPVPDPLPCGCKKLGPLCWWWWIIIAAGLVSILWLVFRRRRKDKQEEYGS